MSCKHLSRVKEGKVFWSNECRKASKAQENKVVSLVNRSHMTLYKSTAGEEGWWTRLASIALARQTQAGLVLGQLGFWQMKQLTLLQELCHRLLLQAAASWQQHASQPAGAAAVWTPTPHPMQVTTTITMDLYKIKYAPWYLGSLPVASKVRVTDREQCEACFFEGASHKRSCQSTHSAGSTDKPQKQKKNSFLSLFLSFLPYLWRKKSPKDISATSSRIMYL